MKHCSIFLESIADTTVKENLKKMVCIEIEENEWEQYFMIPYTVRNNTKFINF